MDTIRSTSEIPGATPGERTIVSKRNGALVFATIVLLSYITGTHLITTAGIFGLGAFVLWLYYQLNRNDRLLVWAYRAAVLFLIIICGYTTRTNPAFTIIFFGLGALTLRALRPDLRDQSHPETSMATA